MELSNATKNVIGKYAKWRQSLTPTHGVVAIHVDEVALRVAAFYEHIRTIVDWKEEHLMRRSAIIRKLKRRFLDLESGNFSIKDIAESLVFELIRGGYFQNDKIEESKILDVQRIIGKYVFIFQKSPKNKKNKPELQFYDGLLEVASCEIEETLDPSIKEMALIDYMFDAMRERIIVNEKIYKKNILQKEEKDIQIYVAVQQALFKLDEPIISYNLLKYKYPNWDNPSEDELFKISQNIHAIWEGIKKDLACPIAKKFYNICEKYDTAYLIVGDILASDGATDEKIYEPSALEGFVKSAYLKRLKELKAKIRRAAIYSIASIFITKILSLFILEYILARVFNENINFIILIIDILIPTVLMALLVMSIKPPSKKNMNAVVIEIMKIFYQKETTDTYEVRLSRKKSFAVSALLSLAYLAGACISFGFIYWVFSYFCFPISSIIINIYYFFN